MKNRKVSPMFIAAMLAGVAFVSVVQAEALVEFSGGSYAKKSGKGIGSFGEVASAVTTSDDIKVSRLYRGGTASSYSYVAGGSVFFNSYNTPRNQSESIANGDFFVFTVSPKKGCVLNLSSLSFEFGGSDAEGKGSFRVTGYVQVDTGNGMVTVGEKEIRIKSGSPSDNVKQDTLTIDLGADEFQKLTEEVTFRIGMYDDIRSGSRFCRGQTILLSGDVESE